MSMPNAAERTVFQKVLGTEIRAGLTLKRRQKDPAAKATSEMLHLSKKNCCHQEPGDATGVTPQCTLRAGIAEDALQENYA